MLICNSCGRKIDEDDLCYRRAFVGECQGQDIYETVSVGCSCGGDYVEADRCELCGEWFERNELHDGVCEGCLDENMTVDTAFAFGKVENEMLNQFVEFTYSKDEINEILKKHLVAETDLQKRAEKYLGFDKIAFAEWLKKPFDNIESAKKWLKNTR